MSHAPLDEVGGDKKFSQTLYENLISYDSENFPKAPPPGLIVSVTGDKGRPPLLRPLYMESLGRDLDHLCEVTGAWVVTTGTDNGVSRLFGELRSRYSIETPFVGFCSSTKAKCTSSKELFIPQVSFTEGGRNDEKKADERVDYPPKGEETEISDEDDILHPDYSHIIVVEPKDGVDKTFQSSITAPVDDEVETRLAFEDYVCNNQFLDLDDCHHGNSIPRVNLIYGGGLETMNIAHHNALNSIPLILVQHSGGFVRLMRQIMVAKTLESEDIETKYNPPQAHKFMKGESLCICWLRH